MKRRMVSLALCLGVLGSIGAGTIAQAEEEGKIINIYVWNDEWQNKFNANYPEVDSTSKDKSVTYLKDGTEVHWIINPNQDGVYQQKLDEALGRQADASADAEDLLRYYENNREGLLPYQSQGLELPEPPEGLEYRNMGTMENHVWSVIARRMKHNHTSWSVRGGNHLAKILAKKCSGKLEDVTRGLECPVFEEGKIEELYGEILMSAKAPRQDGKGYEYPKAGHVVGLAGKARGEIRKLFAIAGY